MSNSPLETGTPEDRRYHRAARTLPGQFSKKERSRAHAGHLALYVTIAAACITGLAIADTQDFGNAYFGIALPRLFPTTESFLGWSVDPWSYAFHALVSYGLLALVTGHVAFVILHKRRRGIELLPRMLATAKPASALTRLGVATAAAVAVIAFFAVRAFVTLGPEETPRDYMTTTPFSAPEQG